jgi:plasmid maintenance system killer protein
MDTINIQYLLWSVNTGKIGQYNRICFIWEEGNAYEIEITDYH